MEARVCRGSGEDGQVRRASVMRDSQVGSAEGSQERSVM